MNTCKENTSMKCTTPILLHVNSRTMFLTVSTFLCYFHLTAMILLGKQLSL